MHLSVNIILPPFTKYMSVDNLIVQKLTKQKLTSYWAVDGDELFPIVKLEFDRLKSLLNVIGEHVYCASADNSKEYIIPHRLISKAKKISDKMVYLETTHKTTFLVKLQGMITKKALKI